MARQAVPLWKSLPAAFLGDRRVSVPNSPKSRPVLRLAVMGLLLLVLVLATGLKMWTNGTLNTQAVVHIQPWSEDLRPSLSSGTTICPCAHPTIPWHEIAQWNNAVRPFLAFSRNKVNTDEEFNSAQNKEHAFIWPQCSSLGKNATYVVEDTLVHSLFECYKQSTPYDCHQKYDLALDGDTQLCFLYLRFFNSQFNLDGPQQQTFSSAYLVAEDVLNSSLQEYTGTIMRDSLLQSVAVNLLIRASLSQENVRRFANSTSKTVFSIDQNVTTEDMKAFLRYYGGVGMSLYTFIMDTTLADWTMYHSICAPRFCTVIKLKGLHNYVLEVLATVGGLLSFVTLVVRALWSGVVFVNVRAGRFEDVVEDDCTEECSVQHSKNSVSLREKFSCQRVGKV